MKKHLLFIIMSFVFLSAKAQTPVDSGYCGVQGNNLTWIFYSDSTLIISGSGAMEDYDSSTYPFYLPWNSYQNTIRTVVIDSGVTSIGNAAFYDCWNLISASLPNSVTIVGKGAFLRCRRLNSIILPDSLISIGDIAFGNCDRLGTITIPATVTTIGDDAFGACRILHTINVDSNNQRYSSIDGVFYNKLQDTLIFCPQAKGGQVIIPNSVTVIGDNAFSYCENLTSVVIPNGVITIGNNAFSYCDYLNNVTISNSVTTIGDWAFFGCNRFNYIIIPNSVTSIGNYAFWCDFLTFVMCNAIIPPVAGTNIFGFGQSVPIYIPCFTYNSYSNTSGWSQYSNNFIINGHVDTIFYDYTKCYGVPYTDANFTTPIYEAGVYTTTLANSSGCDSIIYLRLTEYPFFITNYSAAICQGGTYSDANFSNLTQAGTYYETLQNISGCDSIIELTLTVNPTYFTQIYDTIISGNSYDFYGKLLSESGIYYDTLQTIHGCDSVIELTLSIANVSIPNYELGFTNYLVFPNPTTGQLTIDNGQLTIGNVEIYNVFGQSLLSLQSLQSPEITIDISHLPKGVYFIKINNQTNKFIKH